MSNIDNLLMFLKNSKKRINRLLSQAKRYNKVEEYRDVIDELETLVVDSKIHCYGTKFMELGHERSHLNMFIDVDNIYWMSQSHDKVQQLIEIFQKYLTEEVNSKSPFSNDAWTWEGRVQTLQKPIPTVRAFIEPYHLQCDFTFSSGLGVENTKIINHLFKLQPEAFKLYHFVRIWIHIDQFAFKRYVVALMVIFYLQQRKRLPSVVQMQGSVKEKFIDGWNVNFNAKKKLANYGMSLIGNYRKYLIDFFEFYGKFDFTGEVISTYFGRSFKRNSYPNEEEVLEKFKDQIKSFDFAVVNVTDNMNLNYNCAFNVGKKRLAKFTPFCLFAAELLKENLEY